MSSSATLRTVRRVLAVAATALTASVVLASPVAAHVLDGQVVAAEEGLGTGRLIPTAAFIVGIIGAVVGGVALSRSRRGIGSGGRRGAMVALPAGLLSLVVGILHAANSAGGPGTGNGLVGAWVAIVAGVIAMALGGLVLARARRSPAA